MYPWVAPENASAPQSAQVEATASPTSVENLPATQLVQTVKVVAAEYLQAPQEAHLHRPLRLKAQVKSVL